MLSLDTHILIPALNGTLTPKEGKLLQSQPGGISDIVLWGLTKLTQMKRIDLDIEAPEVSKFLSKLHIWPIDLKVCQEMAKLDFSSDPADEIIAATSVAYHVPLVSRDKKIKASKKVPLANLASLSSH